jgi:hypothetical protein
MDEQRGQMLLERWIEDESFRTQMRSDPIGAASSAGVDLSDEDRGSSEASTGRFPTKRRSSRTSTR